MAFTASCGAQGGLGPAAGTQMFSGLQPFTAGTADGGHDHLWSPAGRYDLTYSVWVIWSFSPVSPEVPSHLVSHGRSSPPSPSLTLPKHLYGGSPAPRGHPHCPTSTACHFKLHPYLLTGQPRLPSLTVSAWSQLPASCRLFPSLSSPCPTLLYQGWMIHIVHQTGSRIT